MSAARGRGADLRARLAGWTWPLLLAAAVWLGFFHGLGTLPLFDVDEGAFGEATREMLARGDYVSTWLNGQPRFDKPILTYWLQAASVRAFGLDEFALRLPSALAATAWIAAIHAFVRRVLDRDTARAAAFIAATSAGVVVIGRGAIADALLNLFLALAMFDIYRELVDPRPRWRRRAFLWIGLGVLTKGPVALLVPGAASAIAFLVRGRGAGWWRAARDPAGWLILLAVAGPWYALEYARRGDAFLAGFFLHHNVERFLVPLQGHAGGPFYYVPALLLVLLPYTGLLLATLPGLHRLRATPLDTLLWCWFLFVFAFFTLAGTKLPHYLLYGATPLFILMARRRRALRRRGLVLLPALLLAGTVVALPAVLHLAAAGARNPYVREALARDGVFGPAWRAQALVVAAAVLLLAVWPARARRAAPVGGGAAAGAAGAVGPIGAIGAAEAANASVADNVIGVSTVTSGAGVTRVTGVTSTTGTTSAGTTSATSVTSVIGAAGAAGAAGGTSATGTAGGPSATNGSSGPGVARAPGVASIRAAAAQSDLPADTQHATGAHPHPAGAGGGPWPRLAAAALLCSYALGGLLLPAAAELQQGPVKRAALLARTAGWPVRSWRINVPSFSVYRGAVTPALDAPRAGDVILTRSDALGELGPVRVLFREGGVLLVRIEP